MKILQISNYYYPHIGGIEQVARDCTNALLSEHEVKVFCFNHEKGNDKNSVDGVEVVRAGCFAKIASQSLSSSYGKLLKKTFKEFKPDVVIFHYPNPFGAHYLIRVLKKYPNCKLVLYWHLDITKQKLLGKLFSGQTKRLLKRASKVLATSPNYIDGSKFLPAYKEKCEVVSCCVNDDRMTVSESDISLAESIKMRNEGKTVCFAIGRHVPYKGLEYLVKASRFLDDGFRIYIGGTGPLTDSLKKLADGDSKITFLGRVADDELKAYLIACDIFCFPSVTKNEAFGIALAEAMSMAKPAVTFTIEGSGVNYVSLNGVTGIEVENGNSKEYAEALKLLASNEDLRKKYGEAAKQRVQELFTEEAFKNKIRQTVNFLQ